MKPELQAPHSSEFLSRLGVCGGGDGASNVFI